MEPAKASKNLVTLDQASKMLAVCKVTLRQWDKEGKLVALRTPGGHRRYRLEDLQRFCGTDKHEGTTQMYTPSDIIERLNATPFFQINITDCEHCNGHGSILNSELKEGQLYALTDSDPIGEQRFALLRALGWGFSEVARTHIRDPQHPNRPGTTIFELIKLN
jgi:excisionase family DNA binding protein